MMFSSSKVASAFTWLLLITDGLVCHGERELKSDLAYLDQPELVWQAQTHSILNGNGIFISPDDSLTVVTQKNGVITAFDTLTGDNLWSFSPPSNSGMPISCQGGAVFSTEGTSSYIVYSVVDNRNGLTPFT